MPKVTVNEQLTLDVTGTESTLLQVLEQYKQAVHYQCREGFCGACRCKLLAGKVRYLNEPLAFVRQGEFLPCCSIAETDIEIEIP